MYIRGIYPVQSLFPRLSLLHHQRDQDVHIGNARRIGMISIVIAINMALLLATSGASPSTRFGYLEDSSCARTWLSASVVGS